MAHPLRLEFEQKCVVNALFLRLSRCGFALALVLAVTAGCVTPEQNHDELLSVIRHKFSLPSQYLKTAEQCGYEGWVVVEATVKSDGTLAGSEVYRHSHCWVLIRAAIDHVKSLFPLPPDLPGFDEDEVTLSIPVRFRNSTSPTQAQMNAFLKQQGESLQGYVNAIQEYPRAALQEGREGVVLAQFTIQSDGAITDTVIVDSSGHQDLDEDAVRTIKQIRFIPNNGCMEGAASFKAKLPVTYALDDLPDPERGKPGWQKRYARVLRAAITETSFYPESARANGWEGFTFVVAVITQDGNISHIWLDQSSSHAVLDRAAIATVRKISPATLRQEYPPDKAEITVVIPIAYELRR